MYAILLAAGLSKRMGRQKLLLPFGESTVVGTVIDNLALAGLSPICAVFSKEVAEAMPKCPDYVRTVINEAPERGQSSSLALGLALVPDGEDFCIMLGDLPLAHPEGMAHLLEKFLARREGCTVVTPERNGAFGHPMFYASVWKKRFTGAEGDMGGRAVLTRYSNEIEAVSTGDGHFKDIDTPEDYRKAKI